mmetsp:Transcript_1720/g.3045  ORF Transcript_1720/g.3045 Transcript_1720/m.3045 type:complete len:92 (+) Transcript_1720:278-553(+)
MYGTWLLLSTMIRVLFSVDPYNASIYFATLFTYCVALFHFSLEIFLFKTVPLVPAGRMPLFVASFSILILIVFAAITHLEHPPPSSKSKSE